jgi:hypothetical protein
MELMLEWNEKNLKDVIRRKKERKNRKKQKTERKKKEESPSNMNLLRPEKR